MLACQAVASELVELWSGWRSSAVWSQAQRPAEPVELGHRWVRRLVRDSHWPNGKIEMPSPGGLSLIR
jgi:hypothetical protein